MISENMQKLLNKQINMEIFSGYLYMGMANYYEEQGLSGFAHWFEKQNAEEWDHAMRIRHFCFDNDVPVTLEAIARPEQTYKSFGEPLVAALEHEKLITASIHKMMDVAVKEKDYRTQLMLEWFVNEQLEEEVTASDNIRDFKLFATCGNGLRHMNKKMGSRE